MRERVQEVARTELQCSTLLSHSITQHHPIIRERAIGSKHTSLQPVCVCVCGGGFIVVVYIHMEKTISETDYLLLVY